MTPREIELQSVDAVNYSKTTKDKMEAALELKSLLMLLFKHLLLLISLLVLLIRSNETHDDVTDLLQWLSGTVYPPSTALPPPFSV